MDMAILGEQVVASATAQFFAGYWMPARGNDQELPSKWMRRLFMWQDLLGLE
jgi:hypothetical protein